MTGREQLVEQGSVIAMVQGDWKYIEPSEGPRTQKNGNENGRDAKPQLYNLKRDLSEQNNLAEQHPEHVSELASLLEKIRKDGKSVIR